MYHDKIDIFFRDTVTFLSTWSPKHIDPTFPSSVDTPHS
jgi:hypothetical protein